MLRVSLFVVILGCGGPKPAPPPPPRSGSAVSEPGDAGVPPPQVPLDRDLDRLAERSVALYAELQRALEASADCPAATTRLAQLVDTHADVIAANAKVLHEGREMQLKLALRRFEDQFQKAAKAIVESKTIAACFQDAAFAKALDGLVGPRPAP